MHIRKVRALGGALVIAALLVSSFIEAGTAYAVGSYDNALIATDAVSHLNDNPAPGGGQCKAFANAMVKAASSNTQNPSGYQSGWDALGDEVSSANAVKGDIIQITPNGSNDSNTESIYFAHMDANGNSPADYRLHTAIIVSNNGGDSFTVVDANFTATNTVGEHTFDPYTWAYNATTHTSSIIKIWRLGTPTSGGSSEEQTLPAPVIAAADRANGEQDLFWKGTDGNLWTGWYSGGTWHGATSLGMGQLGSPPTVAIRPDTGEEDVFWEGTDGNIWEAYNDGTWHGPLYIGMGQLGSPPSAAAWGNEVDVFWKGQNSGLFETVQDGNGAWGSPMQLTQMGALGSAPSAAAHANGVQVVVWKGSNGDLWEAWYGGGAWNGPVDRGMGELGSVPTIAIQPSNDNEVVFWEGGNGNVWLGFYGSGVWQGPYTIGMGPLGSAPSVTAWGSETDVFWRSQSGVLTEAWATNVWNGPAGLNMGTIPPA